MKTMKYETPEMMALTPAIDAIQSTVGTTKIYSQEMFEGHVFNEAVQGYMDWED
jgi:hypothetical protein